LGSGDRSAPATSAITGRGRGGVPDLCERGLLRDGHRAPLLGADRHGHGEHAGARRQRHLVPLGEHGQVLAGHPDRGRLIPEPDLGLMGHLALLAFALHDRSVLHARDRAPGRFRGTLPQVQNSGFLIDHEVAHV
jgi:hypothetical protein